MQQANVITLTRKSNYYDFDVSHNVSFITSNN
jgi:hypothetical protein